MPLRAKALKLANSCAVFVWSTFAKVINAAEYYFRIDGLALSKMKPKLFADTCAEKF